MLNIGEMAKRSGVGVQTLRYYEKEGLIPAPSRRASGYRQYPLETLRQLRFIKRAKELGFSLAEIADLLSLRGDQGCAEMLAATQAKLLDIDEKLRSLKGVRRAIFELTQCCKGVGPTSECAILDALERCDPC